METVTILKQRFPPHIVELIWAYVSGVQRIACVTPEYIIPCPHCDLFIHIESINCMIFRHAAFKANGMHVSPHLPREECERLVSTNLVDGCCKPFRFDGILVSKCEYV